jgi:hypothetical protein
MCGRYICAAGTEDTPKLGAMVPGGEIEPPRSCLRRILSPLFAALHKTASRRKASHNASAINNINYAPISQNAARHCTDYRNQHAPLHAPDRVGNLDSSTPITASVIKDTLRTNRISTITGHLLVGPDGSRYVMGPHRLVCLGHGVAYLSRAEALLGLRERLVIAVERKKKAATISPA